MLSNPKIHSSTSLLGASLSLALILFFGAFASAVGFVLLQLPNGHPAWVTGIMLQAFSIMAMVAVGWKLLDADDKQLPEPGEKERLLPELPNRSTKEPSLPTARDLEWAMRDLGINSIWEEDASDQNRP